MKNLTNQELIDISGGAFIKNQQHTAGISITATSDSLLNLNFSRTNGDQHSETNLSIGNDINLRLDFFGINH